MRFLTTLPLPLFAVLLWCAAFGIAIAAWPLRRFPAITRGLLLIPYCLAIFALPTAFPASPLWLKILVALICPVFAVKLIDMHVDAAHWRTRTLREWAIYLANIY